MLVFGESRHLEKKIGGLEMPRDARDERLGGWWRVARDEQGNA